LRGTAPAYGPSRCTRLESIRGWLPRLPSDSSRCRAVRCMLDSLAMYHQAYLVRSKRQGGSIHAMWVPSALKQGRSGPSVNQASGKRQLSTVARTAEELRKSRRDYMRWYRSDAQVLRRNARVLRNSSRVFTALRILLATTELAAKWGATIHGRTLERDCALHDPGNSEHRKST
jgi:hypothetical protein